MCGIVGYIGNKDVSKFLIKGLKRLEYRGYDSAGIARFVGPKIESIKASGKIAKVEKLLENSPLSNVTHSLQCGIGHTRWATHGKPSSQNAHPHRAEHIALVHNGIIENFDTLRSDLIEKGYKPQSETDSELFGFLLLEELKSIPEFPMAVSSAFRRLHGANSILVMSELYPNQVIGLRNGSPLVVARDEDGGILFASDAQPLLEFTHEVTFLENGEMVIATENGTVLQNYITGQMVSRAPTEIKWNVEDLDKQGYDHYMLKEIFEQPKAILDTVNDMTDRSSDTPFLLKSTQGAALLARAERIIIVACGTSWHAALTGKYWIEKWARIPVQVELASEFKYSNPVLSKNTLVVGMSQSGETADTISVIRSMKDQKVPTLGLTNVKGSTLSREADGIFFTAAGPEIGVAATKTFTSQLVAMLLWAGFLGVQRTGDIEKFTSLYQQLVQIPLVIDNALKQTPYLEAIKVAAKQLDKIKGFFFVGRGHSYPIALEGALKLKEIAYVHAEGYAAGELKHGPIAMIDNDMSVVVVAPDDFWFDKSISNLQEVKARGAQVVGIGNSSNRAFRDQCHFFLPIPGTENSSMVDVVSQQLDDAFYPLLSSPVIQLLSYEIALLKGTDVDQPRNLAKSVTVE